MMKKKRIYFVKKTTRQFIGENGGELPEHTSRWPGGCPFGDPEKGRQGWVSSLILRQ